MMTITTPTICRCPVRESTPKQFTNSYEVASSRYCNMQFALRTLSKFSKHWLEGLRMAGTSLRWPSSGRHQKERENSDLAVVMLARFQWKDWPSDAPELNHSLFRDPQPTAVISLALND